MLGKLHDINGQKIFASCDKSLKGKKISTSDFEITFSESFYGAEKISKKDFLENIKYCNSANLFGKKVCSFLLKEKIITKESIIYIEDIPHVQIYKL